MSSLPDLGMARTAQQECFGDAFLLAVAAVAGCAASLRRPDNDSIDWTLSSRLSRRPKLDVQMKTTINEGSDSNTISYPLKRKNYDDLIMMDLLAPRILVLITLPRDVEEWLSLSRDQLVLRRCAYWLSLAGQPLSDNQTTVTVKVPRPNLFTPAALCNMMQRINEGVLP